MEVHFLSNNTLPSQFKFVIPPLTRWISWWNKVQRLGHFLNLVPWICLVLYFDRLGLTSTSLLNHSSKDTQWKLILFTLFYPKKGLSLAIISKFTCTIFIICDHYLSCLTFHFPVHSRYRALPSSKPFNRICVRSHLRTPTRLSFPLRLPPLPTVRYTNTHPNRLTSSWVPDLTSPSINPLKKKRFGDSKTKWNILLWIINSNNNHHHKVCIWYNYTICLVCLCIHLYLLFLTTITIERLYWWQLESKTYKG